MTITPLDAKYFSPDFEHLPPRELSWIGRTVRWVHAAENYNVIYRASVTALAIFASIAMIASIIGIPLFILFFKEHIRQEQRMIFDARFNSLVDRAIDQNRHWYLRGLWAALNETRKISVTEKLRNKLIHELHISEETAMKKSNIQLLREAAVLHPDWITEYGFMVKA